MYYSCGSKIRAAALDTHDNTKGPHHGVRPVHAELIPFSQVATAHGLQQASTSPKRIPYYIQLLHDDLCVPHIRNIRVSLLALM